MQGRHTMCRPSFFHAPQQNPPHAEALPLHAEALLLQLKALLLQLKALLLPFRDEMGTFYFLIFTFTKNSKFFVSQPP